MKCVHYFFDVVKYTTKFNKYFSFLLTSSKKANSIKKKFNIILISEILHC